MNAPKKHLFLAVDVKWWRYQSHSPRAIERVNEYVVWDCGWCRILCGGDNADGLVICNMFFVSWPLWWTMNCLEQRFFWQILLWNAAGFKVESVLDLWYWRSILFFKLKPSNCTLSVLVATHFCIIIQLLLCSVLLSSPSSTMWICVERVTFYLFVILYLSVTDHFCLCFSMYQSPNFYTA